MLFYKSDKKRRSLNEEMVSFLQKYIRINTSHPNPNYDKAISFLKRRAEKDGFECAETLLPSGNRVLTILFRGSSNSLPSIALNHHMDVVPAQKDGWVVAPFSGDIVEGQIVGRGTQDMKGIGVVHYFALKELKDSGFIPDRNVYIFAVPDEEVGGFKGTKEFVKTEYFKSLNIGFIVDEGHASGLSDTLDIKVAERKPIQILVTSQGELSHGSHLECDNSIHKLVLFLNDLIRIHLKNQSQIGLMQPGELLSLNITSLDSMVKQTDGRPALNVVPDVSKATVDIRVPPTIKKKHVVDILNEIISKYKQLDFKIVAQADEEPDFVDYNTSLYNELRIAIMNHGLKVKPHYFEASSDLRFYLDLGINGVGLTPFAIKDNIHGVNESVPISEMVRGKDIFVTFIKSFCS